MMLRRRALVLGAVQGVGFRPFVAKLARTLDLVGFVRNLSGQVVIEVEGKTANVESFAERLPVEAPESAHITSISWGERTALRSEQSFQIAASESSDRSTLVLPPDLAVCAQCLAEARTPSERRFQYGFGSCTSCGPRFTITHSTPWDRARTSMAEFPTCPDCSEEYRDQGNRRYHAQTIACPHCGPRATLFDLPGAGQLAHGHEALTGAVQALRDGRIVALKGIGGFLLLVRADDEAAVIRLRTRKARPGKPMAVLVANLDSARELAVLGEAEQRALASAAAPIVLCQPRPGAPVAGAVTQGHARIGLMLPSTPLHGLLSAASGIPLVATSGNLHEEPLWTSNDDAISKLGAIADVCLGHDREILRPCDDSVVECVGGQMRVLRRARGLSPHRVALNVGASEPLLAVGGHLKVAPALAIDEQVILWPHIGNLDTAPARLRFSEAVEDIERFFATRATRLACDAHPDYASTIWAEADGRPLARIQHHHAHVAACLAEWGERQCLGVAWDGVGYGDESEEARLWGGEFLEVGVHGAARVHHWLPFPLVGGDAAARDGRRALAGMCSAAGIDTGETLGRPDLHRYQRVAALAPQTTSVGRMFDAVAALTGVCEQSTFEGEAAMRLEALATETAAPYPLHIDGPILDWRPMLGAMLNERDQATRVASRFHATLTSAVLHIARSRGASIVALTGGCFQNRHLLQGTTDALQQHGIRTITPMALPPGDGGLALGQAWVALHRESRTK